MFCISLQKTSDPTKWSVLYSILLLSETVCLPLANVGVQPRTRRVNASYIIGVRKAVDGAFASAETQQQCALTLSSCVTIARAYDFIELSDVHVLTALMPQAQRQKQSCDHRAALSPHSI